MFSGSMVALVTPFDEEGSIDWQSITKLIDYHVESKTDYIVALGTTGEPCTLTTKEHIDTVLKICDLAKDKIPVIAGTGSNSTAEAIEYTKAFTDSGVVGCLTVTPYYNKPPQRGLLEHFKAIADNTDLPQILYNVPSRTGVDLLPKTVHELSKIDNIVGIKCATGDLSRLKELKDCLDEDFSLISGDDATGLEFIKGGGHGVISVTANVAAKQMSELVHLALKNRVEEANRINDDLIDLHKNLFIESNPIPVKWCLKYLNLISSNSLRYPLLPLEKKYESVVLNSLKLANIEPL